MDISSINYALGITSSISYIVIAAATAVIIIVWQKNRTLDDPVNRNDQRENYT